MELLRPLMEILSRPQSAERREFLRLAWQLLRTDRCVVLLWLYDPDRKELVLDRYDSPLAAEDESPALLKGRRAALMATTPGQQVSSRAGPWGISLEDQPQIHEWCGQQRFGEELQEYVLPLFGIPDEHQENTLIGVLHLVAANAVSEAILEMLRYLANGLAGTILRSRRRRLGVLTTLIPRIELGQTVDEVFRLVAEALQKSLRAELCIVYRPQRDLGLKPVASSPHVQGLNKFVASTSIVTHQILLGQKPVRIPDLRSEQERLNAFGRVEYDSNLYALESEHLNGGLCAYMGAPVLFTGHGVAVIVLLNKLQHEQSGQLTNEFSETDEEVLQTVCGFLAAVLPSIEVHHLMNRCSETIFTGALKEEKTRKAVFDVLADTIPGVACAVLPCSASSLAAPQLLYLGGEQWFEANDFPAGPLNTVASLQAKTGSSSGLAGLEERFAFMAKIPHLLDRESRFLMIGLRRSDLSPFEKQLVYFFCRELSQALRGDREVARELEDLLQIRHLIRHDLTGVIGFIDTAAQGFEECNRHAFAPGIVDEVNVEDDLAWANHFGRKVQVLMEESRFLFTGITRDSLRIGSHSLRLLIEQVLKCLEPAARVRKIKLDFRNKVPEEQDLVVLDLQLMNILLFSIIDNAVKYSFRERPVLIEAFVERGDYWRLRVTNWGVYIKEEDREAIFQTFTRRPTGDDATARPGTGLGLAVALAIAKVHGGTIEVDSDPPEPPVPAKTRFFVRIPKKVPRANNP